MKIVWHWKELRKAGVLAIIYIPLVAFSVSWAFDPPMTYFVSAVAGIVLGSYIAAKWSLWHFE